MGNGLHHYKCTTKRGERAPLVLVIWIQDKNEDKYEKYEKKKKGATLNCPTTCITDTVIKTILAFCFEKKNKTKKTL